MVVATQTQIDERNPRYYTFHVKTGVVVISIIEIIYEALFVINLFTSFPDWYYGREWYYDTMVYVKWSFLAHAIIMVKCVVLAIVGMRNNKPAFLIPQIVMQVIMLVIILCQTIVTCVYYVDQSSHVYVVQFILRIIVMYGPILGFLAWFLVVFVRGYKYLKDKKEFLVNNQNSFVAGSVSITCCNSAVYAEGQPAPGQPNYAQFGYAKAP